MGKKRILDNLVEQELLYQEAVKKGINRDPEVRAKAELYRRVIVAQSLLDKELDQASKKYYEENPEEFKKLKMSQIMIRYGDTKKGKKAKGVHSEKQALKIATEVKARLDKGEDFAKVASEVSEDMATKRRGGDMGLVAKGDKRFESRGYGPLVEKAYEMKVDEVSGPIKTANGYHIVKVTRGVELESFDDAKSSIAFKTKGKHKANTVSRLKKEGSVTFADELKPKKAAPGEEGAKPTLNLGQPQEGKKLTLPLGSAVKKEADKPAAPKAPAKPNAPEAKKK